MKVEQEQKTNLSLLKKSCAETLFYAGIPGTGMLVGTAVGGLPCLVGGLVAGAVVVTAAESLIEKRATQKNLVPKDKNTQ